MDIREELDLLELPESEKTIAEQLLSYAGTKRIRVGIFGSFSVGKSELLNRLMQRDSLLPTHTNETTAIVTYLLHGEEEGVLLNYTDGGKKRVAIHEMDKYVVGGSVEQIARIEITLTMPEGLEAIEFIDTPGRNTTYAAHIAASRQALIEADSAVYVLPWQGVTAEDILYLKDLLLYQPHLYFVLNKVDRIDQGKGQTIEDVRRRVEQDLQEQLGQPFHVYAVSTRTGYQFETLQEELLAQITGNTEEMKRARFRHAMEHLLQRHVTELQNQLLLQELALSKDATLLEDEIRGIEVGQQKLHDRISEGLAVTKRVLASLRSEFSERINAEMKQSVRRLEVQIIPMLREANASAVDHLLNNERIEVRNILYKSFDNRLNEVLKDRLSHSLSEVEVSDYRLHFSEPSFEELQTLYEQRLQKLGDEYRLKKERAGALAAVDTNGEDELASLLLGIEELESQLLEEYVPKYDEDANFKREKFTQILGNVGKAGDVVVGIAAAVMTAGASAAAQVAGKAGAEVAGQAGKEVLKAAGKEAVKTAEKEIVKEAGKQMAKEAGKQIAKEVTEEAAKEAAKQLAKEAGKQALKQYSLETLKIVGTMLSPVETMGANIGKMIDSNRSPERVLDARHRQQFYLKKQKLEEQHDAKKSEIERIREAQKANESLSRSVSQKLRELDLRHQEEIKRLEQAVQQDQNVLRQREVEESLKLQLQQYAVLEKERYAEWAGFELERVQLMLEQTLPAYYEEELAEWKERLTKATTGQSAGQDRIAQTKESLLKRMDLCAELRERIRHDS